MRTEGTGKMMTSEKRTVGDYEITASFPIGGREILLGINSGNPGEKYACLYAVCDGLFERYSDMAVSDSYLEIVEEFGKRIQAEANKTLEQIQSFGFDCTPLTADSCIPDGAGKSIEGKAVVRRVDSLYPEFQRADRQIYLVTGGFGAAANARGSAVFGINLSTCAEERLERREILGEIKPECLPEWAASKAKLLSHCVENKRVFLYGNHRFCPYRGLQAFEMAMAYITRNSRSDPALGIAAGDYPYTKEAYTPDDFYKAANAEKCDLFVCLDNGRLYLPAENELFLWTGDIGKPDREYTKEAQPKQKEKGQER